MGYHVSIDESSRTLLKALSTEPSSVFKKLYAGYLLFLVTQHDKQQLEWIVANAAGLDSLTGRHLAFAVFAKSFPIKIRTDGPADFARAELGGRGGLGRLREVSPDLLRRPNEVIRLVENGAFGVILDGDELTAITYGSDLVARELGVLNKLPCLVVLDGVPTQSPKVVPLTPELLPELFQRLRAAINRFEAIGGHKAVCKDAEHILDIQSKLEAERCRDAKLRRRIAEERTKLSRLREKAAAPPTTPDPDFFRDLVVNREAALAQLELELAAFPKEHSAREKSLTTELADAITSHRANLEKTFSHCLALELRSAGFLEGAGALKAKSTSFLSGLFSPETLLKIFELLR